MKATTPSKGAASADVMPTPTTTTPSKRPVTTKRDEDDDDGDVTASPRLVPHPPPPPTISLSSAPSGAPSSSHHPLSAASSASTAAAPSSGPVAHLTPHRGPVPTLAVPSSPAASSRTASPRRPSPRPSPRGGAGVAAGSGAVAVAVAAAVASAVSASSSSPAAEALNPIITRGGGGTGAGLSVGIVVPSSSPPPSSVVLANSSSSIVSSSSSATSGSGVPKSAAAGGGARGKKKLKTTVMEGIINFAFMVYVTTFLIGFYFAYDIVGVLSVYLREERGFSTKQLGALFTVYATPNLIIPIIGGNIIDKLGVAKTLLIFQVIQLIGVVVLASHKSFEVMMLGRFIFGLAGECLPAVVNKIIYKWFSGRMATAGYSLSSFFAEASTVVAFNTLPIVAENISLEFALWIPSFLVAFTLLESIAYFFLDKYLTTKGRSHIEDDNPSGNRGLRSWFPSLSELRLVFRWDYILPVVTFAVYGSSIYTFMNFSSDFIYEWYDKPATDASTLASLVMVSASATAIPAGILMAIFGLHIFMQLTNAVCQTAAYLMLLYKVTPAAGLLLLGTALTSGTAAMNCCISIALPSRRLGLGFGISGVLQSISYFVMPLTAGALYSVRDDYSAFMWFFVAGGAFCVALTITTLVVNHRKHGRLNRVVPNEKNEEEESIDVEEEVEMEDLRNSRDSRDSTD